MTRRTFGVLALTARLDPSLSYIAADSAGQIRRKSWDTRDAAVSFGSLLKPFLVVSYLSTNAQGPEVECRGSLDGCWSARGHGRQNIVTALANSCNVYFRALVLRLNLSALQSTALSYQLLSPAPSWDRTRLIGLGGGWPQTAETVVRAFAQLGRNAAEPSVQIALRGMALCARSGTAKGAGFPCYAKTGTAVCRHTPRGIGDGFAIALYPPDQPRRVLLVSRHNTTGAEAARNLRSLRDSCG